jgi:hypothetical protein
MSKIAFKDNVSSSSVLIFSCVKASTLHGFVGRCLVCGNYFLQLGTFLTAAIYHPVRGREGFTMIFGANFRRQAHVCLRLAEACDDQHLAERLKAMAADLFSKADETEERPNENAGESAYCM